MTQHPPCALASHSAFHWGRIIISWNNALNSLGQQKNMTKNPFYRPSIFSSEHSLIFKKKTTSAYRSRVMSKWTCFAWIFVEEIRFTFVFWVNCNHCNVHLYFCYWVQKSDDQISIKTNYDKRVDCLWFNQVNRVYENLF